MLYPPWTKRSAYHGIATKTEAPPSHTEGWGPENQNRNSGAPGTPLRRRTSGRDRSVLSRRNDREGKQHSSAGTEPGSRRRAEGPGGDKGNGGQEDISCHQLSRDCLARFSEAAAG